MKEFIEKSLGISTVMNDIDYDDKLPLMYSGLYRFKMVQMQSVEWIIAIPKEQINLSKLRKHHKQIEKLLSLHCAIFFKNTSIYSKNTMVAEGIPFIVEGKDIYLPFLGILLNSSPERKIKPVQKISFLTQKIILTAIYDDWHKINVTGTASRLGITKMSASRCFDEIEFFAFPILGMKGKSRVIDIPEDKKSLWENIKGLLRNPVISIFYVRDDLKISFKGGLSALSDYSMIADNLYPTYAVAKKDIRDYDFKDRLIDIKVNEPGCVIQEVGYIIPFMNNNYMDPLSLSLSLTDEDKSDERIIKSVNDMLEEYVW